MAHGTDEPVRIAGYRLVRPLGQGLLGTVWLAVAPGSAEPVALKLIAPARGAGEALLQANATFLREADVARHLPAHPDIVRVLAAGVERGSAWLAMELAPGCELSRYTTPARLLPEPVVLEIGRRLAEALEHAHRRGVVHRDIKPSNVLVDLPRGSLKLTDFGLARLAEAERTRTGLVMGTPAYMAPEQLGGAEADARGDVYALGVVLFQLLTGRLPFEAESLGELLRQAAHGTAPWLADLRPDLPRGVATALSACVARALRTSPDERHASAGQLAAELAQVARAWPAAR
jgi:serine/threonine protein kinase